MKKLSPLLLVFLFISCENSKEETPSNSEISNTDTVSTKNDSFSEFIKLFPDETGRMGSEDVLILPLNDDELKLYISTKSLIPKKFLHFINLSHSAFKNFKKDHFDTDFYAVYKLVTEKYYSIIVRSYLPERRVGNMMATDSEYYLLFNYSLSGDLIDAYPICFYGTWLKEVNRQAYIRDLKNIEIYTTITGKSSEHAKQNSHKLSFLDNGKIEIDKESLTLSKLEIKDMVLANVNEGQPEAIQDCGEWAESIKFIVKDKTLFLHHYTGQETTVYEVSNYHYYLVSDDHRLILNDNMATKDEALSKDNALFMKFN
jgi:hypothetical protein